MTTWEYPDTLYVLPVNAKTFAEKLEAPRVVYIRADFVKPDPREEVIKGLMKALTVISHFSATTSDRANVHAIWKMTERARAAIAAAKAVMK